MRNLRNEHYDRALYVESSVIERAILILSNTIFLLQVYNAFYEDAKTVGYGRNPYSHYNNPFDPRL